MASGAERVHAVRKGADTTLVILDFPADADQHPAAPHSASTHSVTSFGPR